MKRLVYITLALFAMNLASCEGIADNGNDSTDSLEQDTTSAVATNAMEEVTGVVVDGSRRNIYLQVGDSTYDFDLPQFEEDVSWEEGDTLTVTYRKSPSGDSVTSVVNHQE